MNIGPILVSVAFNIIKALLTEKVITNLVVIMAEWLAKRSSNDLDDEIVAAIKDGLDKKQGSPVGNLYSNLKTK